MNAKFKSKTISYWIKRYADQAKWVEDHGGSLAGYVERYGSRDDANHYGNGGEAIYAADKAELDSLAATLKHWRSK